MEQAYKVTQAHQSTQASHASQQTVERATDERTTLYRQFNRVIAFFFADTDEELNDFDALRDVRLFDLILFCSFMVGSFAGIAYFGTLVVLGMFS